MLVVFNLVRKVIRFIDNITLDENIGRSPSRVFNYVVNGVTERFVEVWTSLTKIRIEGRHLGVFSFSLVH